MRSILVLNAKGGCGKSTLATNIASHYAVEGKTVLLADFDSQGSSLGWLAARAAERAAISGIAAWKDPVRSPHKPDYLILDAPAAVHGRELIHLVRHADTALIPVLPSPIDIRAAAHFIRDLLLTRQAMHHQGKVAVVANRVREHTLIYQELEHFLRSLEIPFVATLRETQNYIRAAQQGLGIFELPPATVVADLAQWQPLLTWLNDVAPVAAWTENETEAEMASGT